MKIDVSVMKAAGLSDAQIVAVVEQAENARKAKNRERQAAFQARKRANVTNTDNANNSSNVSNVIAVSEPEPLRACSNTNLPSEDISNIPPLPPKGGVTRKAEPRNRGHRLPEGWTPDAELLEFSRTLGFSADQELRARAEFADFWRGIPGSRGCKLDWPATYRNRLREVAGRLKLKPALTVLPFSTPPPKEEYSEAEKARRLKEWRERGFYEATK